MNYPLLIGATSSPTCLVGLAPLQITSTGLYPAFPAGAARDLLAINVLSAPSLESGGAFHPTALGQAVLAGAVRRQLRRRP